MYDTFSVDLFALEILSASRKLQSIISELFDQNSYI